MGVDTLVADDSAEEIVERDASLSPIRTLDHDRTFRLRDIATTAIASVAAYVGIWALWSYAPFPNFVRERYDWGLALANVLVVATVLILARRRGIRIAELFVRDGRWYVEIFWGVAALLALLIGFKVAELIGFRPFDPIVEEIAKADLLTKWEFLIVGALFVPFAEELVFRGVLQASLYARAGAFMACLLQAIVFGALHWRGWEVVVAAGMTGLFLGALALWRASLLAPIVTHGLSNGIAGAWLVAASYLSHHVPAATMDDARVPPAWTHEPMTFGIAMENSARAQYWKAEETYGIRGWMLPKDEVRALLFVRHRFPDDEEFGAWASLGVAEMYRVELRDPRRAIVVAEELLHETDVRETEILALATELCAYSDLGDIDAAHAIADRIEREYADLEGTADYVVSLREWIDEANPDDE